MTDKRFKCWINGVQRYNEVLPEKVIANKLKQKWVSSVIKNPDELRIIICPKRYVEKMTFSGWSVNHTKPHPVIKLKDVVGKEQTYDLNKLVGEGIILELEHIIAESKRVFGKDYECIYHHLNNKLKHLTNKQNEAHKNGNKSEP